jgi:hypothetical protein
MEGVLLDTALGAVDVLIYYADCLCFFVDVHLCCLLCACLFFAVCCPSVCLFFACLFSVHLLHVPVMCVASCSLAVYLSNPLSASLSVLLSFALSSPSYFVCGVLDYCALTNP